MTDTTQHDQTVTDNPTPQALRPLTRKEQAYLAYQAANPGKPLREAIRHAYNVKDDIAPKTLDNMASTINKRPSVLAILERNSERAEQLLIELMDTVSVESRSGTREGAQYAGVAERVMNSVLDRVHGKAKQTLDVTSKSVNINVDMTAIDTSDNK
jgi:hypothetical protein